MSQHKCVIRLSLTIIGTALLVVTVLSIASWLLLWLDHYVTGDEPAPTIWWLVVGSSTLGLSIILRLLYRRSFGVASDAEGWLRR